MPQITDYASLKTNVQTYMAYDDIGAMFDTWLGLAESKFRRDIRIREMEAQEDFTLDELSSQNLPAGFLEIIDLYDTGSAGGALEYLPPQKFWSLESSRSGTGQPGFYTVLGTDLKFSPISDNTIVHTTASASVSLVAALIGADVLLTDPDMAAVYAAGVPGTFWIDDEQIGYQSIANIFGTPGFLTLTRGLGGTDAVIHSAGAPMRIPSANSRTYTMNYFKEFDGLTTLSTTNTLLTIAPDVYLYGVLFEAQPYLADAARSAEFEGLYRKAIDGLHAADVRARHRPRGRMYAEGVTSDGAFRI